MEIMGIVKVSSALLVDLKMGSNDGNREVNVYGLCEVRGEDIGDVEVEVEHMGDWMARMVGNSVNRELYWRVGYSLGGGDIGCKDGLGYRLDVVKRDDVIGTVYLVDREGVELLGDGEEIPFNYGGLREKLGI